MQNKDIKLSYKKKVTSFSHSLAHVGLFTVAMENLFILFSVVGHAIFIWGYYQEMMSTKILISLLFGTNPLFFVLHQCHKVADN